MQIGSWSSDEEYEETEEVQQMAYCVEQALEKAGSSGGRVMTVEIPQPKRVAQLNQCEEFQGLPCTSAAMLDNGKFPTQYFDLGRGAGPIERGFSQRNAHPIELCRNLTPIVDSPLSPPPEDKYPPSENFTSVATDGSSSGFPIEEISTHFQRLEINQRAQPPPFTDCLICGKGTEQIQDEAVIDYLHRTPIRNETPEQFNARRLAFLAGMRVGTFMLIPGGVSQAAACDGNFYSVSLAGNEGRALPGTVPLK